MIWKNLFEEHILRRGYDYYCSENVQNLKISKNKITASVCGTEDYNVSISLKDNLINEMECTCPYAEPGNHCKHMAAVLYAVQNTEPVNSHFETEIKALLDQSDVYELKNFLAQILQQDETLFLRLKSFLAKSKEDVDLKLYQKQIDQTISSYLDYYGYIEYDDAGRFIEDMEKYLYNDVQQLINQNLLEPAFELISYLFSKVSDIGIDDSDGETIEFVQLCCTLWEKIIFSAESSLKEKIFYWMMSYIDTSEADYMDCCIEYIFMEQFQEPEYLQKKFDYTEERASKISYSDNWNNRYEREHWAKQHINVMEQMQVSTDEILKYCKKYMEHPEIRKYCVSLYIRQGNDNNAISLLEESLILDKNYAGLVLDYRRILKELYRKNGNQEAYREQLWQIVISQVNLDEFRELKAIYPVEKWENVREKLFAELQPYEAAILYKEEGLYKRLLQYVMSKDSVFELKKYESSLIKHYPKQVVSKYSNYLIKSAKQTANRKTYKAWANLLMHMTKIQGGREQACKILIKWRELYPKRKAMMDELDKVKIDMP